MSRNGGSGRGVDPARRQPRASRRRVPVWLVVPAVIALGAGGGYVAAEAWAPTAGTTAGTTAGHSGHDSPSGHEAVADDHGAGHHEQGEAAGATASAAGHGGGTGHDSAGGHEEPTPVSRPRTAVLGGFAAVNAAILLAAAVLRRRRPRPARRAAARTA